MNTVRVLKQDALSPQTLRLEREGLQRAREGHEAGSDSLEVSLSPSLLGLLLGALEGLEAGERSGYSPDCAQGRSESPGRGFPMPTQYISLRSVPPRLIEHRVAWTRVAVAAQRPRVPLQGWTRSRFALRRIRASTDLCSITPCRSGGTFSSRLAPRARVSK